MIAYNITRADGQVLTSAFVNSESELAGVIKCFLALAADNKNIGELRCRPVRLVERADRYVGGRCDPQRRPAKDIPDIEPEFER
jgi:hypothetical protein